MKRHAGAFASILALTATLLIAGCKEQTTNVEMSFSPSYDGESASLVTYLDSVPLCTDTIRDGKAHFVADDGEPLAGRPMLAQIIAGGKVRGFVILEPGTVTLSDSTAIGRGTPLNDRFYFLMQQLDSVDNLDDMPLYLDFVAKNYAREKDNAIGDYLAMEYLKFADLAKSDSLLSDAPMWLRKCKRAQKLKESAELREATSPGHKYADFKAVQPNGQERSLSDFITPGHYTILDFWASWCPFCIREIPTLKEIEKTFGAKGVDIVGVAVRDKAEDTESAVNKHGIDWKVMYNTERTPYDIYGFTGIPHHILLGPDGTIISRGESARQLIERLRQITNSNP